MIVRPVRGIIGKLLAGRTKSITTFFIPEANLRQAQLVPNITLIPVPELAVLYRYLCGMSSINPSKRAGQALHKSRQKLNKDMTNADIKQLAKVSAEAKTLLDVASKRLELSVRAHMRSVKVARTIVHPETAGPLNPLTSAKPCNTAAKAKTCKYN